MSIRRTSPAFIRLAALVGTTVALGAACSGGSTDANDAGELGTVEQIVVSESTGDDGVTESLILTVGTPAELDLVAVDTAVTTVAPWEYDAGENCVGGEVPTPTAEMTRGVATQRGVHLAYFVAEYADDQTAHDAQGSLMCYHHATAELAAALGRTPAEATVEPLQEVGWDGDAQTETRISPPMFGGTGPVIFSGRVGSVVTFLVDLDNGLDEFDGPNLATELATPAS